jgi:hypothetical protein
MYGDIIKDVLFSRKDALRIEFLSLLSFVTPLILIQHVTILIVTKDFALCRIELRLFLLSTSTSTGRMREGMTDFWITALL